jgi:hypothetical protein
VLRDQADPDDQPVPRPVGAGLAARIVAAVLAALVPIFLTLNQVTADGVQAKGWDTYQRVDWIVLIFAVLMILTLAASYASGSPALPAAAVGLAFAMFGLVLVLPVEQMAASNNAQLEAGGILTILASFGAGLTALVATAADGAQARLR